MIVDDQWPVARLIPLSSASGVEAQERRATSALLAVMSAVDEFGRALLKPLGAPAGKIQAFVEVPLHTGSKSVRPDGIVVVSRGSKTWGAIIEAKAGSSPIDAAQIETYLDLAREFEFDAVVSISNQFVTSSSGYPVEIDHRKTRRVALHHWSWVNVLTEALVEKRNRGVADLDQAYMLNELIRFLSDPRSGAAALESMGPSWTGVKEGARDRTLRKGDSGVDAVAARWDDLMRLLALELTGQLGRDVRQVLAKDQRTPAARRQFLRDSLVSSGRLSAQLQVPDAAAPIEIVADLRARQVTATAHIDAPREGRSKGRVSWLVRQLANASEDLKVEARAVYASASLPSILGVVRQNPEVIYPDDGREIRQFSLSLSRNMGLKRDSGKGSFIESVVSTTTDFYGEALQSLKPWKPPPPKLKRQEEPPPQDPPETPRDEPVPAEADASDLDETGVGIGQYSDVP